MDERIYPYDPSQAQQPRPILQSASQPHIGNIPPAMDRSMGTRQSVTFADMPPTMTERPSTYHAPPELIAPNLPASNDHLQAHPPSAALTRPTSLLSAASASSALSELSESLRWAQKFPEGKHLSRARSSMISMLGKDKDSKEKSAAADVAVLSALGYSGAAAPAESPSPNIRNSRSRLSALSLNGILKAPRAWRSEEENQTISETRSGLRFLAKRREEVEEEEYNVDATFAPDASLHAGRSKSHDAAGKFDHAAEDDESDYDDAWEDDMGGRRRYVVSLPSKHSMPHLGGGSSSEVAVLNNPSVSSPRKARWNTFKWVLFLSTIIVFAYGAGGLVASLLTWSRSWGHADVTVVADTDILIFTTLASFLCVLTSVVGLSGAILNNRPILALDAFLLWPTFISMMVVGYSSYKRANLRLDRKLNMAWSRYYTDLDRLRLQNNLHCCGFYSPLHEATFSRTCYPRTTLPGCKGKLFRYERASLQFIYRTVFTAIFIHLGAIAASLLCSNHVNEQFGKGLTPRAYRLDMGHVRRNAVNIMRALIENGEMEAGAEKAGVLDEKAGWTAEEVTPVSSAHGHEEKVGVDMGHAGDLGQHQHDPAALFQNYNFPLRPNMPLDTHVLQPGSTEQQTRPSYTADIGAAGIRVVSYRGGYPDVGPDMMHHQSPQQHPPSEHRGWQRGTGAGAGEGTVRGLGFTMAVPPDTATFLRDRRLGDFA
ncbi:hypothetical protein V8E36_004638 [Tilletia maclaganii]